MIARSTLFTVRGGDTVQAMQTARLLGDHGISVDIKLTNEKINYSVYNLLHFFNITRPADILYHIRKAKMPFVVSTILINYSEYDRGHRKGLPGMIFRFLPADAIEYLKAISRWTIGKDRMMSLPYVWKGQKRSIRQVLNEATLLLPNSDSEYGRLTRQYNCSSDYMVIPNGVDLSLFNFNDKIQKDDKLVLCVARIEGVKNQLNLIRALNNTEYTLLIIGAAAPNQQSYYRACRDAAASNISFVEHVPQEELVNYYQQAKVHVLPSWFETTGLSSLEAAAMGCNIVITDKGDTKEYFGEDAFYCDPSSPENIYALVKKASSSPHNINLQEKITTLYTWQRASLCTLEGYKKVIGTS